MQVEIRKFFESVQDNLGDPGMRCHPGLNDKVVIDKIILLISISEGRALF